LSDEFQAEFDAKRGGENAKWRCFIGEKMKECKQWLRPSVSLRQKTMEYEVEDWVFNDGCVTQYHKNTRELLPVYLLNFLSGGGVE